jgi:hypothetical protein
MGVCEAPEETGEIMGFYQLQACTEVFGEVSARYIREPSMWI